MAPHLFNNINNKNNNKNNNMSNTTNTTSASKAQFRGELLEASLKGNGARVKELVEEYSLQQHDDDNMSPCAILSETTDSDGRTALHFACYSNPDTCDGDDEQEEDIVLFLLDWLSSSSSSSSLSGDDKIAEATNLLNQQDKQGITPLMLAVRNSNQSLAEQRVNALLDCPIGGNNNELLAATLSNAGATALHYASSTENTTSNTIIKRLYKAYPQALEINSSEGGTPLHWASMVSPPTQHSLLILSTLVEGCGANVNAKNEQDLTPLILAAGARNDVHCKYLIKHGADISIQLPGNINIFHMAADLGLTSTLEALMQTTHEEETLKQYCQQETDTGETPLDVALQEGNLSIVMMLSGETNEQVAREMILQAKQKREFLAAASDNENASATSTNESQSTLSKNDKSTGDKHQQQQQQVAEILAKINNMTISDDAILQQSLQLKQDGNTHFAQQEWQQALDCYTNAIKLNPADATFYSNRSACYMELHQPEQALQDALVARHLKPTWTKACYRMAVARMALGLYEDAAVAAFEGLQQEEDNEELKQLLRQAVNKGKKQHQAKLKAENDTKTSSSRSS